MIVYLKRPQRAGGPWLLYTPDWRVVDFIEPTPDLAVMMDGPAGTFEAEPLDDGWDIKRPVVVN
jgi:hypothetical protein